MPKIITAEIAVDSKFPLHCTDIAVVGDRGTCPCDSSITLKSPTFVGECRAEHCQMHLNKSSMETSDCTMPLYIFCFTPNVVIKVS